MQGHPDHGWIQHCSQHSCQERTGVPAQWPGFPVLFLALIVRLRLFLSTHETRFPIFKMREFAASLLRFLLILQWRQWSVFCTERGAYLAEPTPGCCRGRLWAADTGPLQRPSCRGARSPASAWQLLVPEFVSASLQLWLFCVPFKDSTGSVGASREAFAWPGSWMNHNEGRSQIAVTDSRKLIAQKR